jgi:cell division protein FtsB
MNGEQPTSRVADQLLSFVVVFAVFGALYTLLPLMLRNDDVEERWDAMRGNIESLENENLALRTANQRLLRQVQGLAGDRLSVEQRARDEFFLAYPDELIVDLSRLNPPADDSLPTARAD